MLRLHVIDPIEDQMWDRFVDTHPFGWVCHLSGWKTVLEQSFPHMKGHYLVLKDQENDTIRAALPVFEVKSLLTGKRLVSMPFATLSDPLISTKDDMVHLLEAAISLVREIKASFIEIRTLASSPLIEDERLGIQMFYKHHFLELNRDPEELKKSFDRSCVRQRINRALQSGLELRKVCCEDDLRQVYHLYLLTRSRQSLPPQPYGFFKAIWDVFGPTGRAVFWLATKENTPAAALMVFKFKDRVSAELASSDERFKSASPTHFLFWEAIKSSYSEGYRLFDFGRTSPHNASLMDFKSRWSTKVNDLPHFYYPKQSCPGSNGREGTLAYRVIRQACSNAPLPLLERIGKFCYRHLG
jgi:hypothetical protein